MDPEDVKGPSPEWDQIKELVLQAEEESPDDLNAWLETKCADAAIRDEVVRLVRASAAAGDFMTGTASEHHRGLRPLHPARIGRYTIIEELGSGGLGIVYAARDEELRRSVALKVLRAQDYSSAEMRKRLRLDARTACSLQHPNIVVVHDIGEENGLDYIVMEYVRGETLTQATPQGGMTPDRAIPIALRILDGLEAAHAAGIVHRDLKPNNIMIGDGDFVKLLDFGLAKPPVTLQNNVDSPQTIQGQFAGTAPYASPEQAQGFEVDSRGDIFSFGCVLFEMLAGSQAFTGQTPMAVLIAVVKGEPQKLARVKPGIDPRLIEIVNRCLRKDPAQRFQTAGEVKQALAECGAPLRTPLPRVNWRHSGWRGWGIAAVALLAVGWLGWRAAPRQPPQAEGGYNLFRLSADGVLTEDPAISQDGKFIAFASDRESRSNLDIFIQDRERGEAIRMTTGPADAHQPVFSPDGTQLVFRSEQDGGGLYVIPTVGEKKPHLLAPGGRDPRFSPDGRRLAFWTGEEGFSMLAGSTQAMYIPATGGAAKPLAPELEASASPVWDPSGETLLCVGRAKGETAAGWWLVDFKKHTVERTGIGGASTMGMSLLEPAGSHWIRPLAWLRDQTVLMAARQKDATNIWGMRVSSRGKPLDLPRRWTGGTGFETHVSAGIPPDGNLLLVYDSVRVTTSIRKIALTAEGTPAGEPQLLLDGYSGIGPASVDWDGRKIAFTTAEPVRRFVYVMDLESRQAEQVANQRTTRSLTPLLSGDGNWVVYTLAGTGFAVSSRGGYSTPVCYHCGTPSDAGDDDTSMLFESGNVTNQLFACRRGGDQKPVAHVADAPSLVMDSGRWSTDHRWILFCGSENHGKAVYLAPVTADGQVRRAQLVRISADDGDAWAPVWSRDGKLVYYIASADGYQCIWGRRVDLGSGAPSGPAFPVAHFHRARETISSSFPSARDFALSAGPRFLIFTVAETSGDVWMRETLPAKTQ